jgi:hypothetical protein
MKTLKHVFLLISLSGLIFWGCSDDSLSPISSDDQSAISLEKNIIRTFKATEGPNTVDYPPPTTLIDYKERFADGKRFLNYAEHTYYNADFDDGGEDILTGDGYLEVNVKVDVNTGEGFTWGKLTITPTETDVEGGVWEISWHGDLSITGFTELGEPIFSAPLKWVGHGSGGTINGMQFFSDDIITQVDPFNWSGGGGTNCYIKVH